MICAFISSGLTITHFYGSKQSESETTVIEEAASLAEVVKNRRHLAAKANEEKQRQQQEEAERCELCILNLVFVAIC